MQYITHPGEELCKCTSIWESLEFKDTRKLVGINVIGGLYLPPRKYIQHVVQQPPS